jgi:hypothetical protein
MRVGLRHCEGIKLVIRFAKTEVRITRAPVQCASHNRRTADHRSTAPPLANVQRTFPVNPSITAISPESDPANKTPPAAESCPDAPAGRDKFSGFFPVAGICHRIFPVAGSMTTLTAHAGRIADPNGCSGAARISQDARLATIHAKECSLSCFGNDEKAKSVQLFAPLGFERIESRC